jgi:hypothetical protein
MTKQKVRLPLVEQVLQQMMEEALAPAPKPDDSDLFSVAMLARDYAEYCRAVDEGKAAVASRRQVSVAETVRFFATRSAYAGDKKRKDAIKSKFAPLFASAKSQKARDVLDEQMHVEFDRSRETFRRAEKKAVTPYLGLFA